MFHMTLLYPMQLLDELPMIYGSGILIFANYDLMGAVAEWEAGGRSYSKVSKQKEQK
jgi:hypothetical protein